MKFVNPALRAEHLAGRSGCRDSSGLPMRTTIALVEKFNKMNQ
jgi:hypothetical protein